MYLYEMNPEMIVLFFLFSHIKKEDLPSSLWENLEQFTNAYFDHDHLS